MKPTSSARGSGSVPRLLFVYPYGSLDSNPTVALLLQELAARNVRVDVLYSADDTFPSPGAFGASVRLWPLPMQFFLQPDPLLLKALLLRLAACLRRAPGGSTAALRWEPFLLRLLKCRAYQAIVGVDPHGIAFVDAIGRSARAPLVYVSFELLLDRDAGDGEKPLRAAEKAACRRCALVLLQDEERADLFCRDNDYPLAQVGLVPVAPADEAPARSDHLRRRFDLPANTRIVLYVGALEPWAGRDEIAEMVSYWSDRYCLVVHSRRRENERVRAFLQDLQATGRVLLSSEPVERAQLAELVASADYGYAGYRPIPDHWMTAANLFHLGFSSGKVSMYAMCGLPILARDLPVFRRVFTLYDCGRTYTRIADTGRLLDEMDRNYEVHRGGARRFYLEQLNPLQPIQRFVDRLLQIAR